MGQQLVTVSTVALAAVLVGLAVRRWLVFVTQVDSGSMAPTLLPGGRLLTRRVWRRGRIRRGDVVVVVDSPELGRTVVKRILGLPGEQVVIEPGGRIRVDGRPVAEPYVVHPGGPCGVFRVPAGRLLLLGDHRARSSDSRTWREPYLPVRAVRGRVLTGPARTREMASGTTSARGR
ncbi:signal peptidase I [Kocuria sp. CH-021]|uniref:signal peptidase I n=1 Tax=Kocuria sp. CH-021 TaxID=3406735 RepID=UPI003C78304D